MIPVSSASLPQARVAQRFSGVRFTLDPHNASHTKGVNKLIAEVYAEEGDPARGEPLSDEVQLNITAKNQYDVFGSGEGIGQICKKIVQAFNLTGEPEESSMTNTPESPSTSADFRKQLENIFSPNSTVEEPSTTAVSHSSQPTDELPMLHQKTLDGLHALVEQVQAAVAKIQAHEKDPLSWSSHIESLYKPIGEMLSPLQTYQRENAGPPEERARALLNKIVEGAKPGQHSPTTRNVYRITTPGDRSRSLSRFLLKSSLSSSPKVTLDEQRSTKGKVTLVFDLQ